jgi:3-oxoacyl-[acyl-carrier protein] reductase
MNELAGKVAIITGASRGIGAATAHALAEAGASVMLAARDGAKTSEVADAINAKGRRAAAMACDVADYPAVERLVDETQQRFGEINILVNNAGIAEPFGTLVRTDPTEWAENIRINLIGAYHAVRAVLPGMLAVGGGTLIQLSSPAAHNAVAGGSAYCVAKAGLTMLSRMIVAEHPNAEIRVFDLNPGGTDTGMVAKIRAVGIGAVSQVPRSQLAPVEHPAIAIRYLCTAAADDLAGTEVRLRHADFRRRIGLA